MLRLDHATLGTVMRSRSAGGVAVSATRYASSVVLPTHEHCDAYLCLVAAGAYRQTVGSTINDCARGMLMVHPAGHRHSDQYAMQGGICINIHFNRALPDDVALRRLLCDYRRLHLPGALVLQSRLERELAATDAAAPLALQAAALELIAVACRQSRPLATPAWLTRVVARLRDDPSRPASMAELAALAGVHPAHLARSFHRACGTTIGDYVRCLRICDACEALTASRRPIAVIALDAGFADQSHFARVFRRVTGETPSGWRQRTQHLS